MPSFSHRTALLLIVGISHCLATELEDLAGGVIDWIRSKPGGDVNEKVEVRRLDPADETSPLGVFAKADLEAKEMIMQVPRECYIEVFHNAKEIELEGMEDSMQALYDNLCLLAEKTSKEMRRGEESEFAPYVKYLNQQNRNQIPAVWSKEGKDMLRDLLPEDSDGVDWISDNFQKCSGVNLDDPFEEHVIALTKQRSFDSAMIPLYDFVNHDNGQINTENTSFSSKSGIEVRASKPIKAGEEIFASYDRCLDCSDVSYYWGTPEILRDFGFVERYPRRFVESDEDIWFEIWEGPGGEKEVRWDDYGLTDEEKIYYRSYGYLNGSPDEGIEYMKEELQRINALRPNKISDCPANMPTNECMTILQYKEAVTEGFTLAIDSAESKLSDKDEL
mmetsp:Transcript_21014/g.60230  ORF Transcript_21014/g.60230 Transcript_21014/m.60230 type:complete len:391 (-) Transcript_21014:751-1923(-)